MFDLRDWPDPDAMIAELKEMGIELMVCLPADDGKRDGELEEMKENGWLLSDRGAVRIMI